MADSKDDKAKDQVADQSDILHPNPTSDSYTQSLKQLLVQSVQAQCSSTTLAAEDTPCKLSEEDKKFIESALESTVKDREVVNGLSSMIRAMEKFCLEGPRDPTDDELSILEYLEEATEDLHTGDEFIAMGGIKLCSVLLDSQNSIVRETTCSIIANISANNPTFQAHVDGNLLLKRLLVATKTTTEISTKTKLLYASSCIISSNVPAIQFVVDDPELGVDHFLNLYTQDLDLKMRTRTGRIIGSIFRDIPDPNKLNSDRVLTFTKNLLENWWEENNCFVFVNLQLLFSIYNSRNQVIGKTIRTELGSRIIEILKKMKKMPAVVDDLLTPDGEETLQTLNSFQTSLQTEESLTNNQLTSSLSICN